MDKQAPEKKQRGRVNNFMVLAGGYLLYLAYQLVRDAGESAYTASSILGAVAFAAVGGALLAQGVNAELLRKLFGGFLVLVGLSEIFLKGLKKTQHE